ncbi:hypothetical protein [Streptomyces sp. NPDC096132]|uniref:hypothetical protein n=1 Tax=Streptomyces sp. NPDC096132 TaxID=3366075 RepID=UPI0037FD6C6D
MHHVDAGGPRRDLTALLTGFAEAAATVLDSPSESGRVLFTALSDCWQSLSTLPVHEEPYRTDPRTALENFDRVRSELQWALYEVAARGVASVDTAGEAGAEGLAKETPDPPDPVPEEEQLQEPAPVPEPAPAPVPEPDPVLLEAGPGVAPGPADDPHRGLVDALTRLEEDLWREQVRYLGPQPGKRRLGAAAGPSAEQVADLWRRFHMALLRLPEDARTTWRERAGKTAADEGFAVGKRDSGNPDAVIPALPDGLCDTQLLPLDFVHPAEAAARVAPDILRELALSPEETGALDAEDPRLAWAARADQALRLVELDPDLRVALVHDEQPGSLVGQEARDAYRAALLGHLRSAGQGLQQDGWSHDNRLGAAHKLDMVLGGLVHARPAAPDSWWYAWRTRVSRLLVPLARAAKYQVIVDPLGELRRDSLKDCTVAETVKGVRGAGEPEVQWVVWTPLRPYGSLGDNLHRGRLVVRPVDPPSRG